MDLGASRRGVDMGPSALRVAGLQARLKQLGRQVEDSGNVPVPQPEEQHYGEKNAKYLGEIAEACRGLADAVKKTLDEDMMPLVLGGSSGFIYYVSITGITGTRSTTPEHLAGAIPRIRDVSELPIAVGFGVRSPAQAAEAVRVADAAVVGSALCSTIAANLNSPELVNKVLDQIRELAAGVHGARVHDG